MQAQYPAPPVTPRPVLYLGWARTSLEDGELNHSPDNNIAVSQGVLVVKEKGRAR